METDDSFRVREASRIAGTVRKLWKNGSLTAEAKKMLYEGVVVLTEMYGAGTWGLREAERRKLDAFEMGCLRSMCALTLWN